MIRGVQRYAAAAGLAASPAAIAGGAAPVGPADVLSLGLGLVLVVGAILLTGWLYGRAQKLRGGAAGLIRIVASQPLGTKERVVLIDVAGKQLLVGMTSANVQTLHVFDEPVATPTAATGGFAERLRAAVRGSES